ncbi:MAG: hypothetical protein ACYS0D_04400 [Planctomycetota bacterium]|jgi:hypothetical protein
MTPARRGRLTWIISGGLGTAAVVVAPLGCETYRVEYHRRPSFYRQASGEELPDRVTLEDGTIIVFTDREITSGLSPRDKEGKSLLRIREENEDGTVTLRAAVPEDVLANTLGCLRNEEYQLLWDQMVSQHTVAAYEAQGQGSAEFAAFLERNRMELAATLTRMLLGFSRQEAYMENVGQGLIRCRFYPHVEKEFAFKTVDIVAEAGGMRLLMIK